MNKPYLLDYFHAVRQIFLLSRFGLFTDIDGTISEIVDIPDHARVSSSCRESLSVLAKYFTVVGAISGRPAMEARRMVGLDNMVYVGNHGLERWINGKTQLIPIAEKYVIKIQKTIGELRDLVSLEGVIVENKGPVVSIHYRRCENPEEAQRIIMEKVRSFAQRNGFKIGTGKMVVELRPPVEFDKGTAISGLIDEYKLDSALYLGDDITDIDVFRVFNQNRLKLQGVSVAVISSETQQSIIEYADYYLKGLSDVERFFRLIVAEVAV